MPRVVNGLTAAEVKHAKPGRYGDGNGLYLFVRSAEARFWVFRYTPAGQKMREMGLGRAGSRPGSVTLSEARARAADLHRLVRAGTDPLARRDAEDAAAKAEAQHAVIAALTFRDLAERYMDAHEVALRNAKHRAQWRTTMTVYVYPHMGDLSVASVATAHVLAALHPIWLAKPETAARVRGRIEAVLDYARSLDLRAGENPARWKGHLSNTLPARGKVAPVKHHAALPWPEIGAFMTALRSQSGMAARALEFAILTAARSGEVLGASWGEIDLQAGVWTVPAARMKAGREHSVPLAAAAVAMLRTLLPLRDASAGDWVFPGGKAGRPLSIMAMTMALRRMKRAELTVHGFRSTFRDWTAEATGFAREVAEAALAHTLGDKVEAAYLRGDLFEKRCGLMGAWATFCARAEPTRQVVPMRRP